MPGTAVRARTTRSAASRTRPASTAAPTSVCSSARSGRPVALPALSLQLFIALTFWKNSAVVPTSATEFAARGRDGVVRVGRAQLRVGLLDDDLAAGEAALGVHVVAPRLHAVPRTLEQSGPEAVVDVGDDRHRDRRGRHADLGAGQRRRLARVVGRRRRRGRAAEATAAAALPPLPLLPPAARSDTEHKSRREDAPTQPHSVSPGSRWTGRSVRTLCTPVDPESGQAFANVQQTGSASLAGCARRLARRSPTTRRCRSSDPRRPIAVAVTIPASRYTSTDVRGARERTALAARLAARVLARPRREPRRLPRGPDRAALGADRAGRRRRAARVPERLPAPRERALRGLGRRAWPRSAARSTAGPTTSTGGSARCRRGASSACSPRTAEPIGLVPVRVDTWGPLVFVNLDARRRAARRVPRRGPGRLPRGRASTSSAAPRRCRSRRRATGRRSSTASARRTTCRASTARCWRCATT